MSLPYAVLALRASRRTTLPFPPIARLGTPTRCIASSNRSAAQVQEDVPSDSSPSNQPSSSSGEPQKLGKRARKALKARQRQDDERIAKEAKAKAKAEARTESTSSEGAVSRDAQDGTGASPILRVRHVLAAADGSASSSTGQSREIDAWRSKVKAQGETQPTAGWSGSLFRSHISSLLSGFGTSPTTKPLQESDLPGAAPTDHTNPHSDAPSSSIDTGAPSDRRGNPRYMNKSERMESQARVIFQAIQEARERGIVDEDESFFYPYPEGVPPKDVEGRDAVWLNLGADPEAWGREIPQVKDKWLEVLSLGLTKEITGRAYKAPFRSLEVDEAEESELEQTKEEQIAFDDLVDDYDLEDHERLEQLGDSIVNMSSRLLAYQTYPDVNEGSLTRLSNYPTQNNFLALLFQECGLAARRDELRDELRKAAATDLEEDQDHEARPRSKRQIRKEQEAAQKEEDKARLPLLIKRDADMFEAYAAAVFLSNGNDFNVVHNWLCHLFRPFQDQAYRFMVQRSEALARLQAKRAAAAAAAAAEATAAETASASKSFTLPSFLGKSSDAASPTNLAAEGFGIRSASVDPSSVPFSTLFPEFARGEKPSSIPTYALNNTSEAFITDEFLTVAARARRQREERLREELRLQDQQELMNMGWFRKGFLNLRTGFRQYVLGADVRREEELRLRQKVNEQRGMSEKDRHRLRAQERNAAGVSIRSTGSSRKKRLGDVE